MNPEPRDVIVSRATDVSAPLFQRGVNYDISVQGSGFEVQGPADSSQRFEYHEPADLPRYRLANVRLNMLGPHQAANAAAAIAAINRLRERGWAIPDDAVRAGLASARCLARIEQFGSAPAVILDVAHNLASIEALLTTLGEHFSPRRRILVFASSKDKDYNGMLKLLLPAFDIVILTQYVNNPRAMETEGLLTIAQQLRSHDNGAALKPLLHAAVRPDDAWRLARTIAGAADLICITGSFYLAAELRPIVASSATYIPSPLGRRLG
jgi:dihydrofolate synthase / folylpolyglutamate synthase